MLRALLPPCDRGRLHRQRQPARAAARRRCARSAGQLGGPRAAGGCVERDAAPRRWRCARELAGPDGVVLATGSIYLVADLLRPAGAAAGPRAL